MVVGNVKITKCYSCQEFGQKSNERPSNKKKGKKKEEKCSCQDGNCMNSESDSSVKSNENSEKRSEKFMSLNISQGMCKTGKYLDSCASHHMCPFKEWFVDGITDRNIENVHQGHDT